MDIKSIRTNINMTQKQFAELIGTTVRTVQNWEQGVCTPSYALESLIALKVNQYVSNKPNMALDK